MIVKNSNKINSSKTRVSDQHQHNKIKNSFPSRSLLDNESISASNFLIMLLFSIHQLWDCSWLICRFTSTKSLDPKLTQQQMIHRVSHRGFYTSSQDLFCSVNYYLKRKDLLNPYEAWLWIINLRTYLIPRRASRNSSPLSRRITRTWLIISRSRNKLFLRIILSSSLSFILTGVHLIKY